ncbi:replicative DNA helicase [Sulfurospirillum halorespirans]|uniref:Replicative DNA helicase n=1 Tax=Sulfurospirillum halorespirans DSM 13726 TaxID=1193502 RepID=A0A1D7TL75_9BACT|nr:replicative DNA helicase [Sulfurospirillum halorespirans]AOO65747.1 putative endonuclease/helicase [Sulfurospirillum halorespirans DSM 13726]
MSNLHNVNIERSVLSSILFNPATFEDIAAVISAKDFYLPSHRYIYEAMEACEREDLPIDEEFIKKKLNQQGRFDEDAMLEILSTNPLPATKAYVEEIREKAIKRELVQLTSDIKEIAVEKDLPSNEVVDLVQQKLYQITQESGTKEFRESPEMTHATIAHIHEMKKRGNSGVVGVDSGFAEINRLTSGFGEGDLIIVAARPAMGKCLAKGTKVLMYDGVLKNVEDICVGELLMGDDSTPRKVLSLARGRERMYWVRQNKGIDYRVNESHILSLKRSRNEGKHTHGDVLNISIREYLDKSKKFKSNYKGYKVPVKFMEKALEIEPYFLGLWLGDGRKSDVRIATQDEEVVAYLSDYATRLGLGVSQSKEDGKCPMYGIVNVDNTKKESLQATLRQLGVIENKHIPHDFLINSTHNRLELLAGLLDSDGHYDAQCNGYEITQKEEALARQIKFLADTLGFRTSLKEKEAAIESIGFTCKVYRVRIFGNVDTIPVKIKRKIAVPWRVKRSWNQTGIQVEFDQVDDYYGFEIDGNSLFLLEDMTVTHNTAFCLNLAQNALDRGKGVAIFSLEMPAEQLMLRMLSAKTSIPLQKLKVGDMGDEQWGRLTSAADEMSKRKFFVDDNGSVDIHKVRAKLRKLKSQHPEISLAIIDYLQLMSSAGTRDRHIEVSDISRGLKLLARELNIPIIALSQLNRGLEARSDKRPMLSDLRESGAIEQDADMILFVYRDDVYRMREEKEKEQKARTEGKEYKSDFFEKPEESAEVIVGKNRNGPVGVANLIFQKACTRFVDGGKNSIPIEVVQYNASISQEAKISLPPL